MQTETQKKVKKLLRKEQKYFKDFLGRVFHDGNETPKQSLQITEEINEYKSENNRKILLKSVLYDVYLISLYQHAFYRGYHKDNDTALSYFSLSTYAGYHNVLTYNNYLQDTQGKGFILFDNAGIYLSQALLCSWWDKAENLTQLYVDSIALPSGKGIIDNGISFYMGAWFVLDLCCKYFNLTYDKKNADLPEKSDFALYKEVLDNWDSTDLTKIDVFVFKLCELHLLRVVDPVDGESLYEFETQELFPYEVMAFLQLREKAGCVNPQEYSHPLMNTVYSQFFSPADAPLALPEKGNWVDEIVDFVKGHHPNLKR